MFEKKGGRKTGWSPESFEESRLHIVLAADDLLKEKSYQKYLDKLQRILGHSEHDSYETYYLPLIKNYAEFVQIIPWDVHEGLGGLLARGLESAYAGLTALRQKPSLWKNVHLQFAVFSDAMLHFVDHVIFNYKIMRYERDGKFIDNWQPLLGSMEVGTYYKIRPYRATVRGNGALRALLARIVLPKDGFLFLSENLPLLMQWLSLIEEDRGGSGGLVNILQPILERFKEVPQLLNALHTDSLETPEMQAAEDFWKWVKEKVADGTLTVNQPDSMIHRVESGVFLMYPALFEEFSRVYSRTINSIVLYKQFNHMGLTQMSGYDYKFEQYFSHNPLARGNVPLGGSTLASTKTATTSSADSQLQKSVGVTSKNEPSHNATGEHKKPASNEIPAHNHQQKPVHGKEPMHEREMTMASRNFLLGMSSERLQKLKGEEPEKNLVQGAVIEDVGLLFSNDKTPEVTNQLQNQAQSQSKW